MPNIEFDDLDIYGSPALKQRVADLVSSELGGSRSAEEILRTIDFDSGTTKVVGGFVGTELVTMNAFMRMRFDASGHTLVAFQSGFSATDLNHRGRGYWPKLMNFAEERLAGQGAAFIFGYPNPTSHPLFVKKLGYADQELWNFRIELFPILERRHFNSSAESSREEEGVHPRLQDALHWKRRSDTGHSVVEAARGRSRIWGKVRVVRKFGLPVRYLEVGTLDLAPGDSLLQLLRAGARSASAHVVYLSLNPENQYFPMLKGGHFGQPIIVKGLGGFDVSRPVDFFGGMRDTF